MIDLNGLKAANDQWGHAAGDALLRRVGEVLNAAVEKPCHAARIGGDEFVVLMPGRRSARGVAMMENIQKLVDVNNQFYSGTTAACRSVFPWAPPPARAASGWRRRQARGPRMFEAKRAHYSQAMQARRARQTSSAVKRRAAPPSQGLQILEERLLLLRRELRPEIVAAVAVALIPALQPVP